MTPEERDSARRLAKSIKDPEALKIAAKIFGVETDNYTWAARTNKPKRKKCKMPCRRSTSHRSTHRNTTSIATASYSFPNT